MYSRSARIRAFRALQRAPPEERERLRREMGLNGNGAQAQGAGKAPADYKAVHLLSAEEVQGLFSDVVSGLAFLVSYHTTRMRSSSTQPSDFY